MEIRPSNRRLVLRVLVRPILMLVVTTAVVAVAVKVFGHGDGIGNLLLRVCSLALFVPIPLLFFECYRNKLGFWQTTAATFLMYAIMYIPFAVGMTEWHLGHGLAYILRTAGTIAVFAIAICVPAAFASSGIYWAIVRDRINGKAGPDTKTPSQIPMSTLRLRNHQRRIVVEYAGALFCSLVLCFAVILIQGWLKAGDSGLFATVDVYLDIRTQLAAVLGATIGVFLVGNFIYSPRGFSLKRVSASFIAGLGAMVLGMFLLPAQGAGGVVIRVVITSALSVMGYHRFNLDDLLDRNTNNPAPN